MTWHTGEGGDFCLSTSVVLLFESGFILHYNWGLKIKWLWLMILVYEGSVALAVGGFVPHWLWGKLKILWRGARCPGWEGYMDIFQESILICVRFGYEEGRNMLLLRRVTLWSVLSCLFGFGFGGRWACWCGAVLAVPHRSYWRALTSH